MSDHPPVYMVDRVVVAAGRGEEFVDAYRTEYVPLALDRGYRLDRLTVSPPFYRAEGENVVTAVWASDGAQGWWKSAIAGRHDPTPADWWDRASDLIVERTRSMECLVDDVWTLSDV